MVGFSNIHRAFFYLRLAPTSGILALEFTR